MPAGGGVLFPVAGVGAVPGCIGGAAMFGVGALPMAFTGNIFWSGWDLFWKIRNANKQFNQDVEGCKKL